MILNRYILKEHIFPFLSAFSVITFLFALENMITLMEKYMSRGLPYDVILELLVLNLAWILALSIPMSCLVSTLMAFGRFSGDLEVTAMKSNGISPLKMMQPVLIASFLIMIFLLLFNNYVLPEANHRVGSLIDSIRNKKPEAFISSGELIKDFNNFQIWIDKKDEKTGVLRGIQIFEFDRNKQPKLILADSGRLAYADNNATLFLTLYHGENHLINDKDPSKYTRIQFNQQIFSIKNVNSEFNRRERSYRSDRELSIEKMSEIVKDTEERKAEHYESSRIWDFTKSLKNDSNVVAVFDLMKKHKMHVGENYKTLRSIRAVLSAERRNLKSVEKDIKQITRQKMQINKYLVEIHKKVSIPIACIVFVMIGAPLGIMARKGGVAIGIIYSIVFFVIFWACLYCGEFLADKLIIPPWLAMWSPNIILVSVGLLFCYKVTADKYSGNNKFLFFFKKLFGRMKKLLRIA